MGSERNNSPAVGFGKGVQHLRNGKPKHGVAPVRCDIGQGYQHERTVLQTRMRKNQTLWRGLCLQGRIKQTPLIKNPPVRQNQVAPGNKVKIKRAHAPAPFPFTTEFGLDRQKMRKDVFRSQA